MGKEEKDLKNENEGSVGDNIEGGNDYDEDNKWNSIQVGGRELQSSNKDQQFRRDGRNLQDGRGISDTQFGASGEGDASWQVWKNEGELSERTQDELLHQPKDTRKINESPSRGGGGSSEITKDGNTEITNGLGSDREAKGRRTDEMGRDDEQYQELHRRDNREGDNIRLGINNHYELSMFPTEEEQIETIKRTVEEKTTVFAISQKNIDDVLTKGTGFQDGKYRLVDFFNKNPTINQAIEFLKKEYGIGGWATPGRGDFINSSNHDAKGIELIKGSILEPDAKVHLSWNKVANRIRELIKLDRYLNLKEKEELDDNQNRRKAKGANNISAVIEDDKILNYQLEETAYIGANEYSIIKFSDVEVELRDSQFPLLTEIMPKLEFERKLKENPLNQHLFINSKTLEIEPITEEIIAENINGITRLTPYQASQLINGRLVEEEQNESGKYFSFNDGLWVGLDYSRKEGFVEEFDSKEACIKWLDDEGKVVLHEKINFKITDNELGISGAKTKFKWNIEAIKVLKSIEEEDRLAGPEEQGVLSKYVGWGGLAQAFDMDNPSWTKEFFELKKLLTNEEYSSARESTLSTYYTSPIIIESMYEAMTNMGFKTGNIL